MLHGSEIRYDMPGNRSEPHPLLGRFAPDLPLTTAEGATRVAELMRAARPVLLDLSDSAVLRGAADDRRDRMGVVTAHCDAPPADALLIRPDGYVAWACATGGPDRPAGPACGRHCHTGSAERPEHQETRPTSQP